MSDARTQTVRAYYHDQLMDERNRTRVFRVEWLNRGRTITKLIQRLTSIRRVAKRRYHVIRELRAQLRALPPPQRIGEHHMAENTVWYGPHACAVCGVTIVKAAREQGGAEFEAPARLMRAFQRGSEAGDPELVYPMTWKPHVHAMTNAPAPTKEPSR